LPIIFALLNLLSCCYSLAIILMQSRVSTKSFFRSVWAYFDIFYVIINTLISLTFLNNKIIAINNLRKVEAILSIVIVGKLAYYMQLVDEIAPLVNIIIRIFYDILWFVLLLIIALFSLANAFYLIG
jgi:hypothetical protein